MANENSDDQSDELSRDTINTALLHLHLEHRWVDTAAYRRGELRAAVRIGAWPFSHMQPPMVGLPQAAMIVDQLVRTALHAALNTADEQYGRAAQHVMQHGGGRLAAYLDFSGSIDIGDDVHHDLPISATLRLKHERSSDQMAMAKYSGELDGGKIRFRGKAALGGPNYIPPSPPPPLNKLG